jgi:phosphatidylserine/phosphatidylglycerophosphate/cardiolipin synthase-like enzyme
MFRSAQRTIWWGCHSVRPPRIIAETLAEAAARGVDVRLVTNSRKSSRGLMARGVLGYMYWRASAHFHWLLDHGVRIFEWQLPATFHSKNLVVDGVAASVGSYNVAPGSTFHHAEATVIAYGGALPGLVHDQFVRDFVSCRGLGIDDVRPPARWKDPFRAKLEARNLLVPPDLRTPGVAYDLATGNYDPE